MAGGEGTRLRPLTSNCPKPMLPLANRPMMEHIVDLLKKHGIDDIVVTVAFLANQIRTYFGDGSEFGVRMVYATEDQPLGTAGSVRNAMDELDERFLVISGDVLTDIDLGEHRRRSTTSARRSPRSPSCAVDNPLEFGIVITHEDGTHRTLPREAHVGSGVQRHDQHRDLRARAGDLRLHRRRPPGRLLERGLPDAAGGRAAPLGAVAEGYWEDVGTLEAYLARPQGHARRQGDGRTSPASS